MNPHPLPTPHVFYGFKLNNTFIIKSFLLDSRTCPCPDCWDVKCAFFPILGEFINLHVFHKQLLIVAVGNRNSAQFLVCESVPKNSITALNPFKNSIWLMLFAEI